METRPHAHHCPHCSQDVQCKAAQNGGCIFPAMNAITCDPCAQVVADRIDGREPLSSRR